VLEPLLADGDVVLTLGAGSIGAVAASLPQALAVRAAPGVAQ
jgi:UDP-N-acetylmuramate-alanine ligase